MFCPECGKQIPEDNIKFCPFCGHDLRVEREKISNMTNETSSGIAEQSPGDHFKDNYNVRTNLGGTFHEMPMGWFNFLINFSLVAGAIGNFIAGLFYLMGAHYTMDGKNYSEQVYKAFPELQGIDIFMAVCLFALGAYSIWIRFQLAEFKEGAPGHLIAMQILNIVACIFYLVAVTGLIGEDMGSEITSPITAGMITSIVMIIVNYLYFAKRQYLFIN